MYAQKLSFDYAHTLHTVRIVHNAHSVHRSRVQKRQSCDCINFVRATEPFMMSGAPIVPILEKLVGTGVGSGMACMFLCTGTLGFIISCVSYKNKDIQALNEIE